MTTKTTHKDLEDEIAAFELELPADAIAQEDLGVPMFKRALADLRAELLAIDENRLIMLNVDLPAATTIVLGAVREIRTLRPEMVEWFGEEMASAVDRLELLARATAQAHTRHLLAETVTDLRPLGVSVLELRSALRAEVSSLTARKLMSASSLSELRGGTGYGNVGFDVLHIVALLTKEWSAIEHATGYKLAQLEQAEGLANQLITAVAVRDQREVLPTANIRLRAFTLLSETYDDVRRMVGFLRWKKGDADRIAPSWHRRRKAARVRGDAVENDAPSPDATGPSSPR